MSLPAAQQRVLDGIAETLRASEPRLVAMFAMFTRLTRNESAPGREQLPRQNVRDRLAVRLRLPSRAFSRCWFRWRRVLVLAQLAVGVALVGLLIAAGGHDGTGCAASYQGVRAITRAVHGTRCRVQADPAPGQPVPGGN